MMYGIMLLMTMTRLAPSEPVALRDNIRLYDTPYFENTAKALPPSRRFPGGRIVVSAGQPRSTARLLSRPIYDADMQIDRVTPTTANPYPLLSTQAIGTDNQIVRLKDGSLLAVKDSYLWDAFHGTPPGWSKEIVTGHGDHPGQRGGLLFFRSTDGGASWKQHSTVDFATFLGGKYGVPRPMDDAGHADVAPENQARRPDGSLRWWIGGIDRTEIYSCPFTGSVYVSTRTISGPYGEAYPKYDRLLLLRSRDLGRRWEAIREDLPSWAPLMMTSTPDGRLFLMQYLGSQPTVYYSTNLPRGSERPILSPGYPVYWKEGDTNVEGKGGTDVDLFFQLGHPSISRASSRPGSSAVRIAYQTCSAAGAQEARIIRVEVRDPSRPPIVSNVATIRGSDPDHFSVMYGYFIDPDYVDMPRNRPSSVSVFAWIEAPRKNAAKPRRASRCVVLSDDDAVSAPMFLSVADGAARWWEKRQDPGDYISGGFFRMGDTLNYVAQWPEPDGMYANIVTVPYPRPTRK